MYMLLLLFGRAHIDIFTRGYARLYGYRHALYMKQLHYARYIKKAKQVDNAT